MFLRYFILFFIKDKYQFHKNSRIYDYEEKKPPKDNIVHNQHDTDISQNSKKRNTEEIEKSLSLNPSSTIYHEPTKSSSTTNSPNEHDEEKINKFNGGLFVKSASEISNAGSLKFINLLRVTYYVDKIWYKYHLLNRILII